MISIRAEKFHGVRRNEDPFLLTVPPPPRYNKTINGAFSLSAPGIWNNLPYGIRSSNDLGLFKKVLKTHYFQQVFNTAPAEAFDDVEIIM